MSLLFYHLPFIKEEKVPVKVKLKQGKIAHSTAI
jgi:hypothetical protein